LKEELRKRFRIEYLGQLAVRSKREPTSYNLKINDVVFVANDLQKRIDWPLARVKEVFNGRDGKVRVVKLQTAAGELIRPTQKLIPLEIRTDSTEENDFCVIQQEKSQPSVEDSSEVKAPAETPATVPTTRSGRLIKKPI